MYTTFTLDITTLYIHIYTYRIRYLHVTILHIHTCHYLAFILATYFHTSSRRVPFQCPS